MIVDHLDTIQNAFGTVRFETAPSTARGGGGDGQRFALLTEDQATFVITLTRNTPQVVAFKVALVKAFRKAKNALANKAKLESLPDIDPLLHIIGKLRTKGVSGDVAICYAYDILKNHKATPEDWRTRPASEGQRKRLEALGLPVPATSGEASDVYQAFKESHPKKEIGPRKKRPGRPRKCDDQTILDLVPEKGSILLPELRKIVTEKTGMVFSYHPIHRLVKAGVLSSRRYLNRVLISRKGGLR